MAAANLIHFQPHSTIIRASSGHHKSNSNRKNWWTPLFGWSSEPDYIHSVNTNRSDVATFPVRSGTDSEADLERKTVKQAVKFTEEKARKLRMLTVETQTFHDAMYHSAIASRFASDFSDRFDV